MTTEWLKVMLDEIARKRSEAEQAEAETLRRRQDRGPDTGPSPETHHAEDRRQRQGRRHAPRSGRDPVPGPGHERDPAPR